MSVFFEFKNKTITIKNIMEHSKNTSYNLGDELFKFLNFNYNDIKHLTNLYNDLINLITKSKFENLDLNIIKLSPIIDKCLDLSAYTYFYNLLLIDTIVQTYNNDFIRSDIVRKNGINLEFNENFNTEEYGQYEGFFELEEDSINPYLLAVSLGKKTTISKKQNEKFLVFFDKVKEAIISDLIKKQDEIKDIITMIGEYSNLTIIRNLKPEQRMYFYELKGVYDLGKYIKLIENNTITSFKIKYIVEENLNKEEKLLNDIELVKKIQSENIEVKEVYELNNIEEQFKFELLKIIQNNFVIKKCKNCGKLFIPNKTDQLYCNNLYNDTGKTCKEIGASITRKEKVKDSPISKEFDKEYKRVYAHHYRDLDKFSDEKFKKWSKKARKLRDDYTDDQIDEFKMKLKELWMSKNKFK